MNNSEIGVQEPAEPTAEHTAEATRVPTTAPTAAPRAVDSAVNSAVISAVISTVLIGVLGCWGGWQRRWMSDDGLIVLRTVRNLLAGNGPVFNVGERVEANTSTLWQYLIFAAEAVSGASLEGIAMALALTFSVLALVIGAGATGIIHARPAGGVPAWVFPAGAVVYLALPPARDFMTSGLEWGLSTFYLAVLWALLVWWARQPGGNWVVLSMAFWAGLSWLVRPELVLYGGLVGLLLLLTSKKRLLVLAVALPLPAGYEIFRMGYYGLLTPHTAVAKSAAAAAWGNGFNYLADFNNPYWLFLPVLALSAVGLATYLRQSRETGEARRLSLVVGVMVLCAAIHALYVLHVGGDFMHGRMLLLPLFAGLLPVFVVPVSVVPVTVLPVATARRGLVNLGVIAGIAVWALVIVWRGHPADWAAYKGNITIVDERDFWTYATKRPEGDGPQTTADFLRSDGMHGFQHGLQDLEGGDALALRYQLPDGTLSWMGFAREPGNSTPPSLYYINLGMASMVAPLDVRVVDTVGLATPLAARQPRIADGRIGHDKQLSREWQAAESGVDISKLPDWVDKQEVELARHALHTAAFQELYATYRDPLTVCRFLANLAWAVDKGRTLQFSDDPRVYLAKD